MAFINTVHANVGNTSTLHYTPRVYESELNLPCRIRKGNDMGLVISLVIFPANLKRNRRLLSCNIKCICILLASLNKIKDLNCHLTSQRMIKTLRVADDNNLPYSDMLPSSEQ